MTQISEPHANGGLSELLSNSSNAQKYFSSLPAFVKETMMQSHQNIQSEDQLYRCAQNMVQGNQ